MAPPSSADLTCRVAPFRPAAQGSEAAVICPGFVESEATAVNDFEMPGLMTADAAAQAIIVAMAKNDFLVHFPKSFTRSMAWLRFLPANGFSGLSADEQDMSNGKFASKTDQFLCHRLHIASSRNIDALLALVEIDVVFVDPFNNLRGKAAFGAVFEHMFETTIEPQFTVSDVVHSTQADRDVAYLRWRMTARTRGWPSVPLELEGMSEIHITETGLSHTISTTGTC